jgi:hypothetical protein
VLLLFLQACRCCLGRPEDAEGLLACLAWVGVLAAVAAGHLAVACWAVAQAC